MHTNKTTGLIALFAASASLSAFAGTAGTNVYWTRGYDGTVDGYDATNTNKVFATDGGTVFSDRLINAANQILDVDNLATKVVDATTGARTAASTTATATTDGNIYLHIGYINSGFTGAGTTVEDIALNGDLTIGRLGFEGRYQRPKDTWFNTPNVPLKVSAGDSNYTLSFDYTGDNGLFFTRGGTSTGTSLQLDCDINIKNSTITTKIPSDDKSTNDMSLFYVSDRDTLTIGSAEKAHTFTIGTGTASGGENLFFAGKYANLNIYSDLTVTKGVSKIYRGTGNFNIYGNTIINDARTAVDPLNKTDFAFMFMSGSGDTTNAGKAVVKGNITISSVFPKYFYVFTANTAGNQITMDGKITVNKLAGTTGFEVVRLANNNQKATINGETIINDVSASYTSYLFRLYSGDNTNITVNGDLTINKGTKTYALAVGGGVSNSSIDMYGDLTLKTNDASTSIFYNNSPTSTINFYGGITITANTASENIMAASRAAGCVTNYFGKIDASTRTQQTSFASASVGSIVNFKGTVDNTFNNIGFRTSVFNLMNTKNSAAISATNFIAFGGEATLNIFGQNQVKALATTGGSFGLPSVRQRFRA